MTPTATSHLIAWQRSGRFADVIAANMTELAAPDTEILLADRNGDEACCADLRARFAHVPNLRVTCDATDATWVGNIAGLIDAARGTHIQILPHDDSTTKIATDPTDAAQAALAALRATPIAWAPGAPKVGSHRDQSHCD